MCEYKRENGVYEDKRRVCDMNRREEEEENTPERNMKGKRRCDGSKKEVRGE